MPIELKPCPFCGGKGKVSFKDHRFIGWNGLGNRKVCYRVQVICNRCRSRGKPVITDGLVDPNPYVSKWGNNYNPSGIRSAAQTIIFKPYVEEAIEAWNRGLTMDNHTATELAYKNGYEQGKMDAVRHGRWERSVSMVRSAKCSECRMWITKHSVNEPDFRYCPNCGAKMDGE